MRAIDLPTRIVLPFGASAGGSYIRSVPVASQIGITNGAASFTDGFVPLNFLPIGAGGVPPFGQDFNGLLNVMTAWDRWVSAGGSVVFDPTFAAAIGGYPKGARVISSTYLYWWISSIDNNSNDPDSVSTGWTKIAIPIYATDIGTADAMAIAVNLPITSWAQLVGVPLYIQKGAAGNATTTPTLDITANGVDLLSKVIVRTNQGAVNKFDLVNGGIQTYFYDGTHVQVVDPAGGAPVPFSNRYVHTAPGAYTFTASVTGVHRITLDGAGGGGGGGVGDGCASGGAGAGRVFDYVYLVSGVAYSGIVGAGGAGGTPGNIGGTGINTTFVGPAGTVAAIGGPGGQGANAGGTGSGVGGGAGGGYSSSGYALTGGSSTSGIVQLNLGGQGGPGASGAQGGAYVTGGGAVGVAPGGGGSGSTNPTATTAPGGDGGNGQSVVEW